MKINPCPFCGEAAELVIKNKCYYVQCTNSQCNAYTLAKYLGVDKLTEEELAAAAIKKWNSHDEIIGS